jgi:hypothetical protein
MLLGLVFGIGHYERARVALATCVRADDAAIRDKAAKLKAYARIRAARRAGRSTAAGLDVERQTAQAEQACPARLTRTALSPLQPRSTRGLIVIGYWPRSPRGSSSIAISSGPRATRTRRRPGYR